MRINGKEYMGIGCGRDSAMGTDGDSDMGRPSANFAKDYGIAIGKPVEVTFGWPAGTSRPGSRFRIGVYAGVPARCVPPPGSPVGLAGVLAGRSPELPAHGQPAGRVGDGCRT